MSDRRVQNEAYSMGMKIAILMALAISASAIPATAQQKGKVWRIGVFGTAPERVQGVFVEPLRGGLRDAGYVDGRNIVLDVRFGDANPSRIRAIATEFVRSDVDVIVALGGAAAQAVWKVSKTIPIVTGFAANLVGGGMVASIAKPGGNVTGMTTRSWDLVAKWLQLTKEIVPEATRVAVLFNPSSGFQRTSIEHLKSAAARIGVTIQEVPVLAPGEFEGAFAAMARAHADALIMLPGRVTGGNRRQLIALANKGKIPAMCWRRGLARLGCLMSYGANRAQMVRRSASFVSRILRGAKAADLPIEQPTRYQFVLNLKTAKALGITFPPSILLRATEVIE